MAAPLYTTASGLLWHAGKILILTVGLPARGKTHISRALERYLRWTGVKTQVVSLGDYRRKTLGGAQSLPPDYFSVGAHSCICHIAYPHTLIRRKVARDISTAQTRLRRLRETYLGLFRRRWPGCHIRCQQWYQGGQADSRRKV